MLLSEFYTEQSREQLSHFNYLVLIKLNPKHPIFQGHFPGKPVTPGVCMLQITKEICEDITKKKLFMHRANNIRFSAIIDPNIHPMLRLELEITPNDDGFQVKNNCFFEDTLALKISNSYQIISNSVL